MLEKEIENYRNKNHFLTTLLLEKKYLSLDEIFLIEEFNEWFNEVLKLKLFRFIELKIYTEFFLKNLKPNTKILNKFPYYKKSIELSQKRIGKKFEVKSNTYNRRRKKDKVVRHEWIDEIIESLDEIQN